MTIVMEKQRYFMSSIFDSTGNFQLNENIETLENCPQVDGETIIGMVEGTFFVPDGFSRNNRFYPSELWDNQLNNSEINRRLDSLTMFGCIGHSTGPVTEQDLSEGRVSHFMHKLWVDESTGMGMGRAYILNTEAGRNLKTYLKAGCKLKVSSRGEGSFAEGVEKDGHPVVEAGSYNLITFDFVIEPGFTETDPKLMENYIEESLIVKTQEEKGEPEMDVEKILEEYKLERDEARNKLSALEKDCAEKVSVLEQELETAKKELSKAKSINESSSTRLTREIARLKSVNEQYSKLGSVSEIKKASVIAKGILSELREYKKAGSCEDVKKVFSESESMAEELRAYKSLGELQELKKLIESTERFMQVQARNDLLEKATELSKTFGKSVESSANLIEKLGYKRAKAILGESKTSQDEKVEEKIDEVLESNVQDNKNNPVKNKTISESIFEETNAYLFLEKDEDKGEIEDEEIEDEEIEDEEIEDEEIEDEEIEDRLTDVENKTELLIQAFSDYTGEDVMGMSDEDAEDDEDFDFEIEEK